MRMAFIPFNASTTYVDRVDKVEFYDSSKRIASG